MSTEREEIAGKLRELWTATGDPWLGMADYALSLGATEAPRTAEIIDYARKVGSIPKDQFLVHLATLVVDYEHELRAAPAAPGATARESDAAWMQRAAAEVCRFRANETWRHGPSQMQDEAEACAAAIEAIPLAAGAPGATDALYRVRLDAAAAALEHRDHGSEVMFDSIESEAVSALEWADRRSAPVASAGTTSTEWKVMPDDDAKAGGAMSEVETRGAVGASSRSADGEGASPPMAVPMTAARQPEADATPAPAPDPLWAFLETCLGLHSAVELLYVVDGYEVTMTERDGQVSRAHGHGETLRDAVAVARQAFGPEVPE